MRLAIAGPVSVLAGQTVHIHTRLPKDCDYAYVAVFSASGGFAPSPHVPAAKLGIVSDGKPKFVSATAVRLTRAARPKHKLELTADHDMELYLMQDVDTANDVLAKGRISTYGPKIEKLFAYTLGWFYRNTVGRYRRRDEGQDRLRRG